MKDNDLRELVYSLAVSQKATDKQIKATDKQLKELGKQIGGLGRKFGSFTEGDRLAINTENTARTV